MEEAHVNEVHGGMFTAASVSIHRHPIVILLRIERIDVKVWAEVAQEVPARAHEGVHGIGFTFSWSTANRAGGKSPGRVQLEWAFACGQPFHVIRQQHWQLILRHWHSAACRAVDHRNRRSPIALA